MCTWWLVCASRYATHASNGFVSALVFAGMLALRVLVF